MLIAIVGDIHGQFEALDRVLALEPGVPAWLCVGDVGSDAGEYPTPARPFSFIQGNNEDFDALGAMTAGVISRGDMVVGRNHAGGLVFIPNGTLADVMGVRVAGLGGTFAPKWFDTPPEELPSTAGLQTRRVGGTSRAGLQTRRVGGTSRAGLQTRRVGGPSGPPGKRDDKRRHFVRAQVDACLAMRGVDIFLTHEAPRPYWAGSGSRRNDAGKAVINEILAAMRPRLHFFGHHHRFTEATREGVPSIGLPQVTEGYVVVDTSTWEWARREL